MLESNARTNFCSKSVDLAGVYRIRQPSRVVSTTQDNTWIVSDSLSASRNAPTTGHFFRLEPVNLSGIQPDVESILPDAGKEQAASVFAAGNAVVL